MAKSDGSDMGGALEKQGKKPLTIYDYINANKLEFERALPAQMDTERFIRVVLTALRTNTQLQRCSVQSVLAAAMTGAQLGLEINTPLGHAYLIPYKHKDRGYEAQFQLGYQGIIDLAWRSGKYRTIYAMKVYDNDTFRYSYGLNPTLKHIPDKKPEGLPCYYYAVYQLANGGANFVVMSREAIEAHATRYSQSFRKGKESPWQTEFDLMSMKTCIKMLLKFAPKSVEVVKALSADETVKTGIAENMADIPPAEIDYIDSEVEEEQVVDTETGEITKPESADNVVEAAFGTDIQFEMEPPPEDGTK